MLNLRSALLLLTLVSIAFAAASKTVEDALTSSNLLEAAAKGDLEALAASIKGGDSIDTTNVNGWNAAMFTVMNGDIRGTQMLIEQGINLNAQTTTGVTSLMMAASQSDKEIVEVLIAGNASPLIKTPKDETAFSFAVDAGRKVVSLLIAESAVLHGIESQDFDSMVANIKHGAYINIRNGAGYTPVVAAAAAGSEKVVSELIDMGADLNRVENDGWSALHFAAVTGNEKLVALMLKANAAPGIKANDGRTAKSIAETAGFKAVAALIPDTVEQAV